MKYYSESGESRTIDGDLEDEGRSSVDVFLVVFEEFKAEIISLFSGETNASKWSICHFNTSLVSIGWIVTSEFVGGE